MNAFITPPPLYGLRNEEWGKPSPKKNIIISERGGIKGRLGK